MNSFPNINLSIPDLWEVRDVINKVKNVVLNYTEMEVKVHDATNNEAWGASSTLMQEISQGTFNYQYFNEIMPTIYKRFTEKEAKQWRQIYKSLVLLEYLVKNGSERVVDDARSHISMIKMMKNFHYIDEKGKDQGLNVRNRAKELVELLNSTDMIKEERKKAIKNKNKYTGVGSDGGMMYSTGGDSRAVYGDGGGFSGRSVGYGNSRFEGFGSDDTSNDFYDHYSTGKYDDDLPPAKESFQSESNSIAENKPKATTAKDLFDFDDTAKGSTNDDDWGDFAAGDDDFDDFQSAPPTNTTKSAQPTNISIHSAPPVVQANAKKSNDLFDLLSDDFTPAVSQPSTGYLTPQPAANDLLNATSLNQPIKEKTQSVSSAPIGGMWSQASSFVSLDSLGKKTESAKPTTTGPSMNAMKNSNTNSNWNNWASPSTINTQQPKKASSAFDDLLL